MSQQLLIPSPHIDPPREGEKNYTCHKCRKSHERVTALIDRVTPKYGLINWAEDVGREAGYAAAKAGVRPENIRAWCEEQEMTSNHAKNAGGDRGSVTHKFLEEYANSGAVMPVDKYEAMYQPYLIQLSKFLYDYEPDFLASEFSVVHHELDYAGKSDGICVIGKQPPRRNKPIDLTGKRVLFDLKSNAAGRVYAPGNLYQLCAYELAWRDMGGEPNEHQIVVAVGTKSYQVLVNYFEPEAFEPLIRFVASQKEQTAKNPNARSKS